MKCTWKDCEEKAKNPQVATDGELWAYLCCKHHKELEKSIGDSPQKMLRAWVLAIGGAKSAADRILANWRRK